MELLRLSLDDRIEELPEDSPLRDELREELQAANGDSLHRLSLTTTATTHQHHHANRLARPAALTGNTRLLFDCLVQC